MKPDSTSALAAAEAQGDIYMKLGTLTRQLHDTLSHLGVIPALKDSFDSLPDAKSRLNFIATKTGEAAEKVLNLVDHAKAEHAHISTETRRMAEALVADPVKVVASGRLMNFVSDVEASTGNIDRHLTDIMMAQDFPRPHGTGRGPGRDAGDRDRGTTGQDPGRRSAAGTRTAREQRPAEARRSGGRHDRTQRCRGQPGRGGRLARQPGVLIGLGVDGTMRALRGPRCVQRSKVAIMAREP